MFPLKSLLCALIGLLLIKGCISLKESSYSYKVCTYTIDTAKHFFYSNELISFGDYLFEFEKKITINRTVRGSIDTTLISTDTTGVYLLSGKNGLFFKFDTFTLKSKLITLGALKDKPFGQKMNFSESNSVFIGSYGQPKRITINNIDCFITEVLSNNKIADSIKQEILLVKKNKFNSLYNVNGIKFPDANYCIVGFRILNSKTNQSFWQEIEFMRPLTPMEKEVCRNMVKMSKQQRK